MAKHNYFNFHECAPEQPEIPILPLHQPSPILHQHYDLLGPLYIAPIELFVFRTPSAQENLIIFFVGVSNFLTL